MDLSDIESTAYELLDTYVKDFEAHLKAGHTPDSVLGDSPRFIRGPNQPGSAMRYLEQLGLVEIKYWPAEPGLGGYGEYVIVPTENGKATLERSRETKKIKRPAYPFN